MTETAHHLPHDVKVLVVGFTGPIGDSANSLCLTCSSWKNAVSCYQEVVNEDSTGSTTSPAKAANSTATGRSTSSHYWEKTWLQNHGVAPLINAMDSSSSSLTTATSAEYTYDDAIQSRSKAVEFLRNLMRQAGCGPEAVEKVHTFRDLKFTSNKTRLLNWNTWSPKLPTFQRWADDFMQDPTISGLDSLEHFRIPPEAAEYILELKDSFLNYKKQLKSVDLSSAIRIRRIGRRALNDGKVLRLIVIGGRPDGKTKKMQASPSLMPALYAWQIPRSSGKMELKSIDHWFGHNCSVLKVVCIGDLPELTSIGDHFLEGHGTLEIVEFGALPSLTEIGDDFLYFASRIKSLDLTGMTSLTKVGCLFLAGVSGLAQLDLSGFTSVTEIGSEAFRNMSSLKELDLSPMKETLTNIGSSSFLSNCTSLKKVNFEGLRKITFLPYRFMEHNNSLEDLDFTHFSQVTAIGEHFMKGCKISVTGGDVLDLSAMRNVKIIKKHFLAEADISSRIKKIDLSTWDSVQTVEDGSDFLICFKGEVLLSPSLKKLVKTGCCSLM